jgi:leucyl/phenylalanyl-tRNA---protein transferase
MSPTPLPLRPRKVPLEELGCRLAFPHPSAGRGREGLLGVGVGEDLDPGTVLTGYHRGIFPWPAPDMDPRLILWCSPNPRALFPLDAPPGWSRSLRRSMRKKPFRVSVDEAFAEVMVGCADRAEGTWITPHLTACFHALHELGWAHSLEVWNTDTGALAGGIYGLALGAAFTAESMFHRETDASKVAFASLAELLAPTFRIFDAQTMSPHLVSLGCEAVPRPDFLARLADAVRTPVEFPGG